MVFRLLENAFANQKIETKHFHSCPQAKFSPRFLSSPPGRGTLLFPLAVFFGKSIFSQQKLCMSYTSPHKIDRYCLINVQFMISIQLWLKWISLQYLYHVWRPHWERKTIIPTYGYIVTNDRYQLGYILVFHISFCQIFSICKQNSPNSKHTW